VRKHNYRDIRDIELCEFDAFNRLKCKRYVDGKGAIKHEEIHTCEYDDKGEILKKSILYRDFSHDLLREHFHMLHYAYVYNDEGLKVKKTCKNADDTILYFSEYAYKNSLLYEKKLHSDKGTGIFELQSIETFEHSDIDKNLVTKTVKLNVGLISQYVLYFCSGGSIVAQKMLNPAKGGSRWRVTNAEDGGISIDFMDDVLTPCALREILEHVVSLGDYKYVNIDELLTDRFMYDEDNEKVLQKYLDMNGISVTFTF